MFYRSFPTAFGRCGLAWNAAGLTGFWLPEAEEGVDQRVGTTPSTDWVADIIVRVGRHLQGQLEDFSDVRLDWSQVGAFPRAVYLQTRAIKAGTVKSYGEIARALGLGPEASRGVGAALGANPWPLIVPCHRVVSAGGKMTGFSGPGGIRTKTRLLALEGAELLSE